MPLSRIVINGEPSWELHHHLPVVWPWFFDAARITEARRLHDTVFEASSRFSEYALLLKRIPHLHAVISIFEEIRPDAFFRALGENPDAVMSLDLSELEKRRPYDHERNSRAWEDFFSACDRGDAEGALRYWQEGALSPLTLTGSKSRDAMALAARAEEFRLGPEERARALVWLLMGRPVSRPAQALTFQWIERASVLPIAAVRIKSPWWRRPS